MTHSLRRRAPARSVLLGLCLGAVELVAATGPVVATSPGVAESPVGDGSPAVIDSPAARAVSVDLYRPGVYSMQATWTWCTAASVQIMRNILLGQASHSAGEQGDFFASMRASNRYRMPGHRGVDPQGFQAGLRRFVDPRYALVASATYDDAVRSAVTRLRLTGLPVALIVAGGRHAWVLTGFSATADPAVTTDFRVTSLRVVGPLYGRQSVDGYDPKPDTNLSYAAMRRFLLPYTFPFARTPWTGRYLAFEAVSSARPTPRL